MKNFPHFYDSSINGVAILPTAGEEGSGYDENYKKFRDHFRNTVHLLAFRHCFTPWASNRSRRNYRFHSIKMNNNDTNNDDSDHTGPSASMELELSPEECATEDDYHNSSDEIKNYYNSESSYTMIFCRSYVFSPH